MDSWLVVMAKAVELREAANNLANAINDTNSIYLLGGANAYNLAGEMLVTCGELLVTAVNLSNELEQLPTEMLPPYEGT